MPEVASRPGFMDYVRAAFNARPLGILIPPNWVGLAAFGLLGAALDPGFWAIGAGLELGYLALLSTNARFQRTVTAAKLSGRNRGWEKRVDALVASLGEADQRRYRELEERCRAIFDQPHHDAAIAPALEVHRESLGRLTWMYLRLLLMRDAIERILRESREAGDEVLDARLERLRRELEDDTPEGLRKSIQGQIELLAQRREKRREARGKLSFIESELSRIREQVELIREQAALSTDPELLSRRIDEITTTLGGTADWIREQQHVYGTMDDLLTEPPPLAARGSEHE